MASQRSPTAVKFYYTLKLIAGLAFLVFAVWLTYWLVFQYQVRNLVGLAAIIIFLGFPSIAAILTIPGELVLVIQIWRSDDPESLKKVLDDMREHGEL